MAYSEQREELLFAVFGKEKVKQGQEANSFVVDANESIEGIVLKITDSEVYKKVYQLQIKDVDKPVVITGKTALIDLMGHGSKPTIPPVNEGDLVRITYLGMYRTGKGKDAYKFKVEVDR